MNDSTRKRPLALALPVAFLLGSASAASAQPDLTVSDLTGPQRFGSLGDVTSYAFGLDSCNLGDEPVGWEATLPDHPIFTANMYRFEDGRFEQIGLSWVLHGFCALQSSGCAVCTPAQACNRLGAGCRTSNSPNVAGYQGQMGPRSEVNPSDGALVFPFSGTGELGDVLFKRLQVANADLDPGAHPGALYFAEGQHIAPSDALAGNGNNNATYRQITVGAFVSGGYNIAWSGGAMPGSPGIFAWKASDSGVLLGAIDVPGDGRFWVGSRATSNPDGTWHYEYAIQNLNSARAGGSFRVPASPGAGVTGIGFHDIDYHSGEPYDPTDWSNVVVPGLDGAVVWSSPEAWATNPNSNALRWGTLYTFRFDASAEPASGHVELGLFEPGATSSGSAPAWVPAPICAIDLAPPSGTLDFFDVLAFLSLLEAEHPGADLGAPFGVWDFFDVIAFLGAFDVGC